MLLNSFRPRTTSSPQRLVDGASPTRSDFRLDPRQLQQGADLDAAGPGPAFLNSFVVALPATVIPILIAAFAAYAFTFMTCAGRDPLRRHRGPARRAQPGRVRAAPKLYGSSGHQRDLPRRLARSHRLRHAARRSTSCATTCPALPNDIIESAKIDGASHFTTFWRLIMPMSAPALASFAIFQFLWVWNDLLVALIFLGRATTPSRLVALQGLQGQTGAGRELIPAAAASSRSSSRSSSSCPCSGTSSAA